eukprot:TRINITY_DN1454_c0_g1_i1.p1 TRINITY_DN1454_c0_g1~~TRINITY_DN1454_c0_g1_i1.p1  ORF type:complete len:574 (+),score=102.44 TRINITY_DN1454_c0_g1_i1:92-1723(+)
MQEQRQPRPRHYATLKVKPTAPQEEIRDAYKRLARESHPDRAGPEGEEQFKRISTAYDILSDPERRKEYDATLAQRAAQRRVLEPGRPPREPRRSMCTDGRERIFDACGIGPLKLGTLIRVEGRGGGVILGNFDDEIWWCPMHGPPSLACRCMTWAEHSGPSRLDYSVCGFHPMSPDTEAHGAPTLAATVPPPLRRNFSPRPTTQRSTGASAGSNPTPRTPNASRGGEARRAPGGAQRAKVLRRVSNRWTAPDDERPTAAESRGGQPPAPRQKTQTPPPGIGARRSAVTCDSPAPARKGGRSMRSLSANALRSVRAGRSGSLTPRVFAPARPAEPAPQQGPPPGPQQDPPPEPQQDPPPPGPQQDPPTSSGPQQDPQPVMHADPTAEKLGAPAACGDSASGSSCSPGPTHCGSSNPNSRPQEPARQGGTGQQDVGRFVPRHSVQPRRVHHSVATPPPQFAPRFGSAPAAAAATPQQVPQLRATARERDAPRRPGAPSGRRGPSPRPRSGSARPATGPASARGAPSARGQLIRPRCGDIPRLGR